MNTPTPITDEAWAAWPYAGSGISVHVGRELERELTAVTEQRDRLAAALTKIQGVGLVAVDAFDELDRIDEIVDEALQSLDQNVQGPPTGGNEARKPITS